MLEQMIALLADARKELAGYMVAAAADGGVKLTDADVAEQPIIQRLDAAIAAMKI